MSAPTPPLAAGDSYTQSDNITLPLTSTGQQYLLFVADDDNQQPETDETNNVFAVPIYVTATDLTVVSVDAPTDASFGQSVTVSWTVQNNGSGPADLAWTDGIYFSTRDTLDGSAVFLGGVPSGADTPLAAGDSYTHSAQVTLPLGASSADGSFYILVATDYLHQQVETNENNNVAASQAVNVTLPPLPDLVVDSTAVPASGYSGQTVAVSWTDLNNGAATANGPWTDTVYLAEDSQGTNPVVVGSFSFAGSLAAGESVQRTQSIVLPHTPGTYWLMVTTNADGGVAEGPFVANDTTLSSDSIDVAQVPLPDLVVTNITPPSNGVLSGTDVPISFVVQNQGTAPTSTPVWQDWVVLSQDPNLGSTYQGLLNPTGPGGDQTLNNQPVIVGFNNPSYLDVGESYTQTVNVSLPIDAQGTWYVYVIPDGTGFHHPFKMAELSRTDKLAISGGFSITLSPPPDLAVTGVEAPLQNFSGQSANLVWTVANNGAGPTHATDWFDAVFMSSDDTLDGSDTLLGTFSHSGLLDAGASYTSATYRDLAGGRQRRFLFLRADGRLRTGFRERSDGEQCGRDARGRYDQPDASARPCQQRRDRGGIGIGQPRADVQLSGNQHRRRGHAEYLMGRRLLPLADRDVRFQYGDPARRRAPLGQPQRRSEL